MKLTRHNITPALAVEQLRRLGISPEEGVKITREEGWWSRHQWPDKESEEKFRDWAVAEIRRVFRMSKKAAEREFSWFNLAYGLKSAGENNE